MNNNSYQDVNHELFLHRSWYYFEIKFIPCSYPCYPRLIFAFLFPGSTGLMPAFCFDLIRVYPCYPRLIFALMLFFSIDLIRVSSAFIRG
ncbi:MAG: hypothetical protein QOH96_4372 [Blastocatellia bacterium]|jgi:hypothetical protein|nr:hypothetical protein [Blastocatellia bacterium]